MPAVATRGWTWWARLGDRAPEILAGLAVGCLGVLLAVLGNPRNSGICVSCFLENIAGALGMHGDTRMMYLRPEIPGFLLGATVMALVRGEFHVRSGSGPLLRLVTGFFVIVGCAVFIGCPIKLGLRLTAGDLTALAGAAGLGAGVLAGVAYLRRGFTLGRSGERPAVGGAVMPALMLLLLAALLAPPSFVVSSVSGPGALHPAWWISLGAGLAVGLLAQRSRFCVTGSLRNLALTRDPASALGLATMLLSAFALSAMLGQFHPGMYDQPGAHPFHLWNFLGLSLAGFGSVLLGGCPFRQLILAGEGDLDAGVTIVGMLLGGGAVYAWGIRSTTAGPTLEGKVAVLAGLAFLFVVANAHRSRE